MNKLSALVKLTRKNFNPGGFYWVAEWRGTGNRVLQDDNETRVMARTNIADLRFDLLNNPMENGVLAREN